MLLYITVLLESGGNLTSFVVRDITPLLDTTYAKDPIFSFDALGLLLFLLLLGWRSLACGARYIMMMLWVLCQKKVLTFPSYEWGG
jgi:hypothetical protein